MLLPRVLQHGAWYRAPGAVGGHRDPTGGTLHFPEQCGKEEEDYY